MTRIVSDYNPFLWIAFIGVAWLWLAKLRANTKYKAEYTNFQFTIIHGCHINQTIGDIICNN